MMSEKRNQREKAEHWYLQGTNAMDRRDFPPAEEFFRKALQIYRECGDEEGQLKTFHMLVAIAREQHDFSTAEQYLMELFTIYGKRGDEDGQGNVCRMLEAIARERHDSAATDQMPLFEGDIDATRLTETPKTRGTKGSIDLFEDLEPAATEISPRTAPPADSDESVSPERQPHLYPVWYGTNRAPKLDRAGNITGYTNQRSEGPVYYGKCEVTIPQSHQFGSTGSAWWKRWLRMEDDRLKINGLSPLPETEFWAGISNYLSQLKLDERISVVFIHGYNVSFQEAAIRTAQIGFDLKIAGAMAFFSWPSKATLGGYLADEAGIEASEDEISNFLMDFARKTGSEKIHIIAHSMGNRGLLRAIQRITGGVEASSDVKFGQIILAAPDLDVDVFKNLARLYPAISERTTLYASAKDRAVECSHILHKYDRAGFIPPVTVVPGIDTVEVTNIDLSLLGHSYVAEAEAVLYDMHELIFHNAPPDRRARLSRAATGPHWVINA